MGFETSHWCFLTVQMETHENNLRTEASRDCRELGEWTPAFAFWGGQVQGWGILAEGSRGRWSRQLFMLYLFCGQSLLDPKVFNVLKSPSIPTKFTIPIWINFKPGLGAPFTLKLGVFFQKRSLIIISALILSYLRNCWNLVPKIQLEFCKNSRNGKMSCGVDLC